MKPWHWKITRRFFFLFKRTRDYDMRQRQGTNTPCKHFKCPFHKSKKCHSTLLYCIDILKKCRIHGSVAHKFSEKFQNWACDTKKKAIFCTWCHFLLWNKKIKIERVYRILSIYFSRFIWKILHKIKFACWRSVQQIE